jgi:DNA-binding response OmpR family regulator
MPTILVVDDEPRIVKLARDYLEKDGYHVISAQDGNQALQLARNELVDLIVLDLMLPGLNGWEVCRALRREGNVPIIMLTARAEESDQIVGLELGADDYITKPFSPRALVARVRAVLRRANQPELQNTLLVVGDLQMDLKGHQVWRAGELLHLTPNEFRLLSAFAQHPRQTLTREQLLDQLHGISLPGFDRSIDSHIKNLRRKLEPDPANPRYIETVYGIGYRFDG